MSNKLDTVDKLVIQARRDIIRRKARALNEKRRNHQLFGLEARARLVFAGVKHA